MSTPDQGLAVKDASGVTKELAVELLEGSGYLVPYHYILGDVSVTASSGNPLSVNGTVEVSNFPATQEITASLINRVGVTGSVTVNNFPSTQTITASSTNPVFQVQGYGINVSTSSISSVTWDPTTEGTFKVADLDYTRRELIIHNSGPGFLYIKLSPSAQDNSTRHGFTTAIEVDKVPLNYNFIIYPSGTYMTSEASRVLYHGGFFVSSSTPLTGTVQVTNIS